MEEERSLITYDENWQSVSEPEYAVPSDSEDDETAETLKRGFNPPGHLLLTVQLIACVLIGLAVFAVKGIGGAPYDAVREWYSDNLNDTAIFTGSNGFDAGMLVSTADEF